jgi:hypothetical protein
LGIEIAHSQRNLFLSQRKYVFDLLKETEKLGYKPSSTPMNYKKKLNTKEGQLMEDVNQYQRLVGKLIYLTMTRPDLAFSVSRVS